ncbi:MAG: thioredoxin family protein [Rikenellaceae bacterium]|nr:thioredoxin family protein [Rikenellaceae bacterium]
MLVDFYARWCAPCKTMHPILENLKREWGDRCRILKLDIDAPQNRALIERYAIRSVPTLYVFKQEEIVWRHTGAIGLESLREIIEKFSAAKNEG